MPHNPPSPCHTIRTHTSALTSLYFSSDNERLYTGDAGGVVSILSTRTIRPLARWKAHEDGILGVEEWEYKSAQKQKKFLTHGRDNKLHVWVLPDDTTTKVHEVATQPDLPTPELVLSLDVNALNYCRFSLLPLSGSDEAYVAVPNLVESSFADVWSLPTRSRSHAAIGKHNVESAYTKVVDGRGVNALGIIMSLHLFVHPTFSVGSESVEGTNTQLRLLCGYENGSVTLWGFDGVGSGGKDWSQSLKGKEREKARWRERTSVEGVGWEGLFTVKLHVESVMAMSVTRDNTRAFTVSADHLIGAYDLMNYEDTQISCAVHRTKYPGNAAVAIRDDGRICAIGGWDGKIRLYSARTFKTLGTLDYHKKNTQALAFAHPDPTDDTVSPEDIDEDEDDELTASEKESRSRWLAAGSQDCRVSIWPLISFEKT